MTPSLAIQKILAALKANHEEAVRLRMELEKHFGETPEDAPGAGSPIYAGPRPKGFILGAAEDVLSGDMTRFMGMFVWGTTPQGHEFWSAQNRAGALSPEGRAVLEKWLAE